MQITSQKIYATLRKAGYQKSQYHASGRVRGWGTWSAGVEVSRNQVEYTFGSNNRNTTNAERIQKLQAIQKILIDAGIQCYPNAQETALIIGDPNA